MRHGESQEKGQEESQEEVILLALCQWRARSLSLAASNSKTLPATSRAVSFQGPEFSERLDECPRSKQKRWKTSCRACSAGIRHRRKSARCRHRVDGELPH